jgi:hypothetical protein
MELDKQILSEVTVFMKYAKYLPEMQRRETWHELVTRNMDMHIKKYPQLETEIREISMKEKNKIRLIQEYEIKIKKMQIMIDSR